MCFWKILKYVGTRKELLKLKEISVNWKWLTNFKKMEYEVFFLTFHYFV